MAEPQLSVLLIDDGAAIRRAVRTSLNEIGFTVVEAWRGEDAGHWGMETLTRLRSLRATLPSDADGAGRRGTDG